MFTVPNMVYNARRGYYLYVSGAMVFRLLGNGVIVDGSVVLNTTVSQKLFLEISTDLIPTGSTMEQAQALLTAYLAGSEITPEDIGLFKQVYPDWAADTEYLANIGCSYGMTCYIAAVDHTSVAGDVPPAHPELYATPFAPFQF